jgi:hypothetical protein
MTFADQAWQWREQDGHPEIRLEPVSALQRRVAFARSRADGYPVGAVGIMLCLGDRVAGRYEASRLAAVAAYEEMCAEPGHGADRRAEAG